MGDTPELRTPPSPATHVRAGTGHRTQTQNYTIVDTSDPSLGEFTRTVRPRVARELRERRQFGSVSAVARAHHADLATVSGVGPAKAALLVAAFELARRGTTTEAPVKITGPGDVATVVTPLLRGRTRERLVAVACDKTNRVIGCDVLTEGSADRSLLAVREVIVAVLRRDAKSFALAHNHPSGNPAPSRDDLDATVRVRRAATAVGLQFLEHVVVTDREWQAIPFPPRYAKCRID